jgi:phosphoribosylformylglycinamidine synthase subunit PurQ / glutaminase
VRFGIVVFPGSNCDHDCYYGLEQVFHQPVRFIWHGERRPAEVDCYVLPGGFSYGDYLRTGAIARFSPVMEAVRRHADAGKPVIGICNGFQILLEAGLLPGAMLRNRSLRFVCKYVHLRVESPRTPFTQRLDAGQVLQMPIAHGEGNYTCDPATLRRLRREGRIVFRYSTPDGVVSDEANPNGSLDGIAGICNEHGNVLGMMPHPERCLEPELGSSDGRQLFYSLLSAAETLAAS